MTFLFSFILRGKMRFDMIDVQNATLAGGVAVGSSSDLVISPGGALTIGFVAGIISTFGFAKIQGFLERKIGIQDTCGIMNLHGMPGILGGIAGTIAVAASKSKEQTGLDPAAFKSIFYHGDAQPAFQLAALFITIGIASFTGMITGFWVSKVFKNLEPEQCFEDSAIWEVPEDYNYIGVRQHYIISTA